MNTRSFSTALLAAALAACNTMPDRNPALDQSRNHLQSAQQDTQVRTLAPDELQRAAESVALASRAQARGDRTADVDHLAYMADQRVTLAQETASARGSQALVASAGAERDKTRLAMRTREADTANAALAMSQQSGRRQQGELMDAQAQSTRGQARIDTLEAQLRQMGAKKTDRGMVVTLGGILFYTGQDRLLPAAQQDIRKLADFFKRNPTRSAVIEGNTDSVGGEDANHGLSQRRADAVAMALVQQGVSSDRLKTAANGEDSPVATNTTAAGRQMNRRVEVIFAPQADTVSTN
jgi:outer membrane protein OmpA-like peptidoglycan-associated protein